jgi:hypothetical protein
LSLSQLLTDGSIELGFLLFSLLFELRELGFSFYSILVGDFSLLFLTYLSIKRDK